MYRFRAEKWIITQFIQECVSENENNHMQREQKHIHFFHYYLDIMLLLINHVKRRMKKWEEFCRMTFIKVRRQLTKGGREEARGDLQTKPAPQPPNLIQYKSPGIKLFRLMARQTNVVETRLRLYNQDQVPRSPNPPPPLTQRSLSYTIRSSRATPTAITISVATDTTTTIPQLDSKVVRS